MRVLMIVAPQEFRDEEYLHPREELEKKGARITVASLTTNECAGRFGAKVTPDISIDKVDVDDYDAVVFVGGGGSKVYFDNDTALRIAKEFATKGKVTSAICIAPMILANAGLLKGRKATAWDHEDDIKNAGGTYTGNPVEVDGNIITANGPDAARDFGREIAKKLE